jgi:hypothetical protein
MADEKPDTAENEPEKLATAADEDVLGGLESLLDEEGAGLALPDEDLTEDDLNDLFDEDEDDVELDVEPASRTGREARQERKQRDREDYRNLEAHLQATPLGLVVADDKMAVRVSRVTGDNSSEEILALLKREKIINGIDHEAIRTALSKAATGQHQFEVTVARGSRPKVLEETHIVYHLPDELITDPQAQKTDFERLKRLKEGEYLEACKNWQGAVKMVRKGDLIAELKNAEIELGCDVFGEEVDLEGLGGISLEVGENVTLSEDGTKATADLFGYSGLLAGLVTVVPPIWMSSDHMEARFIFYSSRRAPPVPTEEDLNELLEMKWVEYGVMEKQIELICQRLAEKQALPTTVPLAQGSPEIHGGDAQIKYSFDPFELIKWNQLQSLLSAKAPEAIQHNLTELYDGEEECTIRFKAVRPAEVVAEKLPATAGVAGRDIQGEEVTPNEGNDVPLEVGEGLAIDDDGLRAKAEHYGYVALRWDIETNILSPLWISPDRTAVYFLNLPQAQNPRFPSVEDMQILLDKEGAVHGFTAERWAEILAELEEGKRTKDYVILVAQGTLPQPGSDAEFDWMVAIDNDKPGRIMEDGSIDFRDRNLNTVVKEGDMLGKLVPPKVGVAGKDVFGNELQPPSPLNIEVVTDSRIYAEPVEGGAMAFYCETGGGISTDEEIKKVKGRTHKRINIGVYPISNIEGDVDYSTGNIDFNGDVVVGGSVQSQFSVKATGTVTIGGYIEAGAYVTAGQDILIQRGVVGASTELVAGGDIMSKFIQEATARAGGNVKVGSYIFNASVRARGEVIVPGMGEGKSRALVGGLIWGAKGISARSIGSPYNAGTRLVVGIDPDQVNRADQIRANMHACQEKQRKLLKKLGVESLDVSLIKQRLARCPSPKQKQAMLMAVKRIAKVAELEQNQQAELEEIAEAQRKLSHQTNINVVSELFAGVELRIGEQTETVREDKEKVSFKLVTEDEEVKIQEEVLSKTIKLS